MNSRRNGNANGKGEPAVKRCAIYTRVSTAAGLSQEITSLDVQREACEAYVLSQAHQGWQLIPEHFDDGGFTGANLSRPALRRLMQMIEQGEVQVLLVYKLDRISRSLLDFLRIMEHLTATGVAFTSVTQGFSTGDPVGRLTMNLLAGFGQFERELISERTRDKVVATRRKGRWTGGFAPLGYDLVDRKLIPNEMEATLVRDVFALYVEHHSYLAVARHLNASGRLTKRVQLKSGRIREGHPWSKVDVLRVLRNPIYVGMMPCGDEAFPAAHEPIVDRAVFDRVQALLDGAGRDQASHGRNPEYLLRGLIRCATCGAAMTPASTRKNGHVFRYYRCSTRDRRGADACPTKEMPAQAIEEFVVDQIRGLASDADLAVEVADSVRERLAGRREALATERKRLPAAIASLSAAGKKLIDALADLGPGSRRLLDERLADISRQISVHETRLAEVERQLAGMDEVEVEAGLVASLLGDFSAVWSALTPENRGRLVRALVREVVVDEPAGKVTVSLADLTGEPAAAGEVQA